MRVPSSNLGAWAKNIISKCSVSRKERFDRGEIYRNLFLTGDSGGAPQTFNMTFTHIDNLASFLYSPVELRFSLEHYGLATPVEKAMEQVGATELYRALRQGDVDTCINEAVLWSLIKGKTFIKLLWGEDGFEPYLVQPELMGVLREDIDSLDRQEAFFHSTYYTLDTFAQLIENHPDAKDIMKKVSKNMRESEPNSPGNQGPAKEMYIPGLAPYQVAGQGPSKGRGNVFWLAGPVAALDPIVRTTLIRMDELWVWDDFRDDYTVIQVVADDVVVTGKSTHSNIFADMFDPDNTEKRKKTDDDNPLSGKHPFIEICPNQLSGYFWGRSEICNIAVLQDSINKRIDGINTIMRKQEDPPKFFAGSSGINQQAYAKLRKPGGYLTDSNPNVKMQSMAPEMPPTIFDSLHEFENMFNTMGGFTPALQGRGESGVRAQGHAETLTRNASPRFKDRALLVERQIEVLGGLALDMMKAKVATEYTAWVEEKKAGLFAKLMPSNWLEESPIPGMKPVPFLMSQLPTDCKVVVDSHSSSPAFSFETRELLFTLFKAGAIKPEQLIQHTSPPGKDEMLEDIKKGELERQAFAEQHPEAVLEAEQKASKKKKK